MDKPLRVLIVEDSVDDAELLLRLIKKGGYSVYYERICTAKQMEDSLCKSEWDVIISDYKMPGFSGIKALEILNKHQLDIPFILVSGNIGEQLAVEAMKKGANDYIMKDNLSRLVPAIEREIKEAKIRSRERNSQKEILRLNRMYSLISDINQMIVRAHNKKEVFDKACQISVEKGNFVLAWLGIVEDNSIVPVAFSGLNDFESLFKNAISADLDWSKTFSFNVLNNGKTIIFNDIENCLELNKWKDYFPSKELKSMAIVPLKSKKKSIGAFYLYSKELNFFNEEEIKLLEELADDISFAIESIDKETKRKEVEKALIESENRFKSIFNNAAVGIDVLDRDFKFLQLNDRLAEMLDYKTNELIGKSILDVTFIDDYEITTKKLKEIVEGDLDSYRLEKRYKTKNGNIFWGEVWVSAIRGDKREFIGIIGVIVDINQRKIMEEKLLKANTQLENIIEFLPDATFIVDENDNIIAWNRAIEEMTGIPKKEMIGKKHIYAAIPFYGHPRKQLIDILYEKNSDIASKYDFIKFSKNSVFAEVFTPALYNNKGAYVWAIASNLYDNEGNIVGAIESIREITEIKKTQNSLKESEEKYRELVENANSIIAKFDKDGRILSMNEFGLKLFGYSKDELIGKTWNETILPKVESTGKVLESLAIDIIKDVDKYRTKLNENIKKNGERIWVYWTNKPIVDENGQINGILSVGTDVTDRIKAEKQMEQNIEYFAHLVDHIRNPLAILSGFVQVKVDDEELKARIIRQVDRIEDIIKQLDKGWMDTEDTREFLKKHR